MPLQSKLMPEATGRIDPDAPSRRLLGLLVPLAVGAAAFGLAVWTSHVVGVTESDNAEERFSTRVQRVQTAIEAHMAAYEQVLRGGVALFDASEKVDRQAWRDYVKSVGVEEHYPGIQGMGFLARVTAAERDAHIRRVRAEGHADYTIWPEGNRPVYATVVYLEPFNLRNQGELGYDMMAEATFRAAMEQARDTGAAAVSGMVKLMQEAQESEQAGFLTYLPVYRKGLPTSTVDDRRAALMGYVYGPFRMNDLMRGILRQDKVDLALEIHDGPAISDKSLAFVSEKAAPKALFTHAVSMDLNGRTWTLNISSLPNFEARLLRGKARAIMIAGIPITLLLMAVTWLILNMRARALAIAYDMTLALRESKSEILRLNAGLEQRVLERTSQLDAVNKELETFAYSVSHDLRAPLRSMVGFCQALVEDYSDKLDETGKDYVRRVSAASKRMGQLIDDLLTLSRVTRAEVKKTEIDLSGMAETMAEQLRRDEPGRNVEFKITPGVIVQGDEILLRTVIENLLGNAWKYSAKRPYATIEFGIEANGVEPTYFVRDNGAGFDMAFADKLFKPFQRLHGSAEFEGTGIGLASVANIVRRHGGRVWAEAKLGAGATLLFTIPSPALE